jgi:sugar-specific transcriptional regulator TrmB
MNISNGPGRPSELTEEIKARILEAVPEVLVQAQIAKRSKIPKQTLNTWLTRGISDKKEGIDSIYAQFSDDYNYALSQVVKEMLDYLKRPIKNYGSMTWVLERCFREDFGSEGPEIRELRDLFKQAFPDLMTKEVDHGNKADPHLD